MLKNRSIPFGYCMVNGKYTVNNDEAEVVQKIFSDYIGGKSLKTIAAEMTIPYNTGKTIWNINMVCRIIENTKYIGNNIYPSIITPDEFQQAAQIKSKRSRYRKPQSKSAPSQKKILITEYNPTDEIQHMTNDINRLLDSKNHEKEKIEALILKCAQEKYAAINEVRT